MPEKKLPVRHGSRFTEQEAQLFNAVIRVAANDIYTLNAFHADDVSGTHATWCSGGLQIDLTIMTECDENRRVGVEVSRDGRPVYRAGYELTFSETEAVCGSAVELDTEDDWKAVVLQEAARLAAVELNAPKQPPPP